MLTFSWPFLAYSAQSDSIGHHSPHAVSYNSRGAASSVFSLWICGEDCDISKISWSALSPPRTAPFPLSVSLYHMRACVHTLHTRRCAYTYTWVPPPSYNRVSGYLRPYNSFMWALPFPRPSVNAGVSCTRLPTRCGVLVLLYFLFPTQYYFASIF